MKLPSLQQLAAETARVVRRFPLTLLCALVLCGAGLYYNHLSYQQREHLEWLFPLLSGAGLGLSGTLAVALTAERYRWRPVLRWGALAAMLGLLAVWYAVAPAEPTPEWGARLALLLLGTHLAVAAGPYLSELRRQADTPGFWRYNETLFLRILSAALYSGVLFAGCALALVAVENLFFVDIKPRIYADLFVVLGSIFNTWFFLAGIPHNFAALEQETSYPKGLKVFTQFVLLPLVVLYLGILYAYLARIMVTWELPEGWVSILILAFSVAGIFALLLIHPIRHAAENTWIRTFGRWFYRALFPLLGLLAVAIGTRIRAYGITEERYFVLVLAAWLFGIALYFLARRGQGLIWIPASLAVVAFVAAGGPWGAFAVAQRSQLNQLREISVQYGLLKAGKLDGAGKRVQKLPEEARKRISSIFDFFSERQTLDKLQPFFMASIQPPDSIRHTSNWVQRDWLRNRLEEVTGIAERNRYADEIAQVKTASFQPENPQIRPCGLGCYFLGEIEIARYNRSSEENILEFIIPEGSFRIQAAKHGRQLYLQQQTDNTWQTRLTLHTSVLADSLVKIHGEDPNRNVAIPASHMTLRAIDRNMQLQFFLNRLYREDRKDTVEYIYSGQAMLEIKK
ncbi:DUF4153 domain-containing protein [Hymenobacter perfusus]|uniref:DUF4153 domain-containing protein n=1 Tax=Hymenobacter perfusus TaxID=1236770 RepID=A0A3R9PQ87_9BACT|nr:DUF4153 domain-containing protein [Hymenobacter perfusus]RSK43499.1 DUF4153 domain-containing protein [Hymenobacter perfusus]